MSWSVSFVAKDKAVAKRALAKEQNLPTIVRMLIEHAIDGIISPTAAVLVDGSGHQAGAGETWDTTTCNLKILPVACATI